MRLQYRHFYEHRDSWDKPPKGGATAVYDPVSGCGAIARCSGRDYFSRRLGVSVASERLELAKGHTKGLRQDYLPVLAIPRGLLRRENSDHSSRAFLWLTYRLNAGGAYMVLVDEKS